VFVNTRSGGQYGSLLLLALARLLERHQIFDLNADGGPEKGLLKYKDVKNLRILVCGGDGSVGWVLNTIDKIGFINPPPIAILPLGTGNDLARTLGWGTGYSGEELSPLLDNIENSMAINLYRWMVKISSSNGDVETKVMNNYMSIGVDAGIALEFHNLRNAQPELFTSQFVNKFWYAHYGLVSMFTDMNEELSKMIDIEVDGKPVKLPDGLGGIMILNLPSYAGGSDLWGTSIDSFKSQAIDDKLLEVVAITGSFHMGTIATNLSEALRITQGTSIRIKVHYELPMQVDGEPWCQKPASLEVEFHNQSRMLFMPEDMFNPQDESESDKSEVELLLEENKKLRLELEKVKQELEQERAQRIQLTKK